MVALSILVLASLFGCALTAPAPCPPSCYKPCKPSCYNPCQPSCYRPCSPGCFTPNTPYSFFSSIYSSQMSYSYYSVDMCASVGIDTIPSNIPTMYFDDIERMLLEAKCRWINQCSSWYPPNIGPNIYDMTREMLTADFIIVDTGAGSLSCLPYLIQQGFSVIVIDEGHYPPPICQSDYYRPAMLNSPFVKPYQTYVPGCSRPKNIYVPKCFGGESLFDTNTWQYGSRSVYESLAQYNSMFSWESAFSRYQKMEYCSKTTVTKETEVSVGPCGYVSISTSVKETSVTSCISSMWSDLGFNGVSPLDIDCAPGLSIVPGISSGGQYGLYPQQIFSQLSSFDLVKVILGLRIERLIYECGRIIGVEIITEFGRKIIYCRYDVILGSSAIEMFQLLTRSGFGPSNYMNQFGITPIQEFPMLGRNLRCNPIYIGPYILFEKGTLITEYISDYSSAEFAFGGSGMSSLSSLSYYSAFYNARGCSQSNIMYRFYAFNSFMSYRIQIILLYYFQVSWEVVQIVIELCFKYDVLFIVPQHLSPRSVGYLEFGASIEEVNVVSGMYTEEEDILDMIDAVMYIDRISKTSIFSNMRGQFGYLPCSEVPFSGSSYFSADYIRQTLPYFSIPNLHVGGGAIMGNEFSSSVVNSNFYFHNLPNLMCLSPAISPIALQSDSIAFSSLLGSIGYDFIMDRYNSGFYEQMMSSSFSETVIGGNSIGGINSLTGLDTIGGIDTYGTGIRGIDTCGTGIGGIDTCGTGIGGIDTCGTGIGGIDTCGTGIGGIGGLNGMEYESAMKARELEAMSAGGNLLNVGSGGVGGLGVGGMGSSFSASEAEAASFSSNMRSSLNGMGTVQSIDSSYAAAEYESGSTSMIGGGGLMGGGMVTEYEKSEAEASSFSASSMGCGGMSSISQTTSEACSENVTIIDTCGC